MEILTIYHSYDHDNYISESHEALLSKLDWFVKDWWEMELPGTDMPENRQDRIDVYFDAMFGIEDYEFDIAEVL